MEKREYVRPASLLPASTRIARLIRVGGLSRGNKDTALRMVEQRGWHTDMPELIKVLKAESTPMDSLAAAAPLADYGFSQAILDCVRGQSVLAALRPRMSRFLFTEFFSNEQVGAGASWITEQAGLRSIPDVA